MHYYRQGIQASGSKFESQVGQTIKKSPIDKYTLGHLAWGGVLAALGVPFWGVFAMSIGFELLEQPLKVHLPELFPEPLRDPIGNQVMDTVGVLTGWSVIRLAMYGG